jgi:hypothetical protein
MKKSLFLLSLFIWTSLSLFAQVPSYVPTNGLVGYWPFNGNANDESGNGRNLSKTGTVPFISDRNGVSNNAIQGGSGYYSVTNNFFKFKRQDTFSVSVWYTVSQSGCGGRLISTESPEGHLRIATYGNGVIAVQFGEYININSTPNIWHHLVYTYLNKIEKVYLDGSIVANAIETELSENLVYNSPFTIGAKATSAYDKWCGNIDDIAIYNRALTPQEINALYTGVPPCQPTSSTTNLTVPSTSLPYTWNGLTFNTAGSQTATLTNAAGCDSSATLNLNVTNTIPSYLPSNGLVGYWPFNGNANDESGNGNHGAVNGATLTTDRFGNLGKAYGFDGVNSFIQILNSNSLNFTEGTINLWFITSQSNFMSLIERTIYTNATNENWAIGINETSSGDITLYTKHNSNCQPGNGWQSNTSNQSLSINNWHMITGVIKDSVTEIYIEGILVQTFNTPSIIDVCGGDIQIGRHWSSDPRYFNGSLDDIAIYNRALTPQEIAAMYSGCTSTDSSSFSASACNQYTLPWGDTVTQSGTFVHTYTNNGGCDSIVTAQITINTASDSTQGKTVNGNGTYTLPSGDVATQSGYYTHNYSNQYGCDSVVTFYVVINQSNDSSQSNVGINVNQPQRSLHVRDVIRLEPRNTPPNNPTKGDMYFDGTTDKLRIYDGRGWRDAY